MELVAWPHKAINVHRQSHQGEGKITRIMLSILPVGVTRELPFYFSLLLDTGQTVAMEPTYEVKGVANGRVRLQEPTREVTIEILCSTITSKKKGKNTEPTVATVSRRPLLL